MPEWKVIEGDSRRILATLDGASIDAVITDPPYEIGFMGKRWDRSGIAFNLSLWLAVWQALKPGGHLLAFGGTRTFHRLAVAIEDAGFEIRDCLMWLYGTGYPKSHTLSREIDERAGVPMPVAQKSATGSRIASFGHYVPHGEWQPVTEAARQWQGWGTGLKPAWEPIILARRPLLSTAGKSVQQFGTGGINVDACRIPLAEDEQDKGLPPQGRHPANLLLDEESAALLDAHEGASRFFFVAKANREERDAGGVENLYPTVKPVMLMRHLVRLITPPGGVVLDPFAGSGSTGIACVHEGAGFVGIEREPEYATLARNRIAHAAQQLALSAAHNASGGAP